MKFSAKAAADLIKKTIEEIEAGTAADVVVVLRARSAKYGDVTLAFAAACSWLYLCILVYSPVSLDEFWWPLELVVVFVLSFLLARRIGELRRFISQRRLQDQVESAARAAFTRHEVDRTVQRLGILVYVSAFERRAFILPDKNAVGKLPPGHLLLFEERLAKVWARNSLDQVCVVLKDFGKYLHEQIPPNGHSHELADDADFTPEDLQ